MEKHRHAEESKEIGKRDPTNGHGIQGLRNEIEDRKGKGSEMRNRVKKCGCVD
jgi:hypothetical protein